MGIGGFFKKLPGRLGTGLRKGGEVASLLHSVGVPIPAIGVIKGAMLVVEARGGKDKASRALELALPQLERAGLDLPERKIRLMMELLLDSDLEGMGGEDAVLSFATELAAVAAEFAKQDERTSAVG